jgi:hypothetical protein
MYTTHNMYLRNRAALHLSCTLHNLIDTHKPSIGIALATTERAELTVKQADIRGLDMDISVIIDHIATHLTLTLGGKLT